MPHTKLIQSFAAIVGGDAVLTGEPAAPYLSDWRGRYSGNALAVVFPSDTQQVAGVVQLCAAGNVAIVPQGGNTSLCGGSVPLQQGAQIVLNLSRMDSIRGIDPANYTMTVEAGCKLADVRDAAEKHKRFFPLGLTATQKYCEIGGNLSTNAGGINVLRYGNARDLVLGLEVVLPDGRIWNGLRSLRKDNSGYDLKHLFIGAEGTLGVITAAVLKLYPRPQAETTACVAVRDPAAAVALLSHLRASCGDKISSFEIIARSCLDLVFKHIPDTREPFATRHEWIVITRLADVLPAPLDAALRYALNSFGDGIVEFEVTTNKDDAERWWKLRKNIAEAQKREGLSIKHDISVPISRVAEFIEQASDSLRKAFPGIRIVAFGHVGDGNIHYNCSTSARGDAAQLFAAASQVNRVVYEVVNSLGGSISAEHGLGTMKTAEAMTYKSPVEVAAQRAIRAALDPGRIMNPRVLF